VERRLGLLRTGQFPTERARLRGGLEACLRAGGKAFPENGVSKLVRLFRSTGTAQPTDSSEGQPDTVRSRG